VVHLGGADAYISFEKDDPSLFIDSISMTTTYDRFSSMSSCISEKLASDNPGVAPTHRTIVLGMSTRVGNVAKRAILVIECEIFQAGGTLEFPLPTCVQLAVVANQKLPDMDLPQGIDVKGTKGAVIQYVDLSVDGRVRF
jgi:hypothetical protein